VLANEVESSRWKKFLKSVLAGAVGPGRFLWRGPLSSQAICLTFDDGPDPTDTPRLLDVLGKYQVRASFFLIGARAAQHPNVVRRLVDAGHVIGNHSYWHNSPAKVSARALVEEVRQTRELLADLTGKATNLFRPPFGALTIAKLASLWRAGQTVVHWNRNPGDACSSAGMLDEWFRDRPPQTGDLVLLHDNHPHARIVLPSVIESVRGRGLEFATLAEWTGLPMPEACGKREIGGDLPRMRSTSGEEVRERGREPR